MRVYRGISYPSTFEELCESWENYYNTNGIYPNSTTCAKDKLLPTWSSVKYICGDRFEEFKSTYKNEIDRKKYKPEHYYEYCQKIIDISNKINRTPTVYELKKYDETIPDYRWFISNAPIEEIKDYNSLMNHIGLKPNYFTTKEMASEIILRMYEENGRALKKDDFLNPKPNDIGLGTIKRIWGSLNEMFKDLSLPINQENMLALSKPLSELEDDIKRLCESLYLKNGHKHVSIEDIIECEWCSAHTTYNKKFKEAYDLTISEYIEHIGYISNKAGMGMNFTFEDGEFTGSKYEYIFSNILRSKNINYERDVRYDSFIDDYTGNKDCDYVINLNGDTYYIEIAGMLRDCKSIEHAKTLKLHDIQQKYLRDLIEKDTMLKNSKFKYYILFPCHINDEDFLVELIKFNKAS